MLEQLSRTRFFKRFKNPVKNHVLESYSNIFFTLVFSSHFFLISYLKVIEMIVDGINLENQSFENWPKKWFRYKSLLCFPIKIISKSFWICGCGHFLWIKVRLWLNTCLPRSRDWLMKRIILFHLYRKNGPFRTYIKKFLQKRLPICTIMSMVSFWTISFNMV